jgi:hypothetical protein
MRALMTLLILFCVFCIISAVTGIQTFETDSRAGTVISYYHGYGRLYALAAAAFFALAFYGVYRRSPITWKLGWLFLLAGAADLIFEAWLGLIHQPYGWMGALAAAAGVIGVTIYWGIWWQRHRDYFARDVLPAGWSPDLTPLRWFGIGMVAIALIFIFAALAMGIFRH